MFVWCVSNWQRDVQTTLSLFFCTVYWERLREKPTGTNQLHMFPWCQFLRLIELYTTCFKIPQQTVGERLQNRLCYLFRFCNQNQGKYHRATANSVKTCMSSWSRLLENFRSLKTLWTAETRIQLQYATCCFHRTVNSSAVYFVTSHSLKEKPHLNATRK